MQTLLNVEVVLLDGTDKTFELDPKGLGLSLLDAVAEHLGLLEKDYFGFLVWENVDCTWTWLNNEAKLLKQFKHNPKCYFQVKFYPPEPSHLQEDLTRYLLCLQLQSDIKQGKLPCSFVTHTLLGAFMVQSELGDHDPDQHGQGIDYLRDFDFAPSQSDELLEKIWTAHKKLKGQTSAEAELHYLENAKKLAMYGFSLQNAKDSEGIDIVLGVCSSGVVIFRDNLRINRFVWPKIIKLAYKNANFFLKLRPGEHEHIEYTVGFRLRDHREAKRLWKISVEHHSFFRLESQEPKERFSLLSFSGSTFRYYGRTQFEVKMNSKLLKEQMTRDALMDEEGDDNYPQIPSSYHKHRNPHYHPPVKEPEVEEDQKSDQKANESLAPSQSTSTMDDTPVIDLSITGNKRTSIFDTASVTTVGGKPRYQSPWGKSSAIMTRRKFLEATPGSFLLDDRQPLLSKAAIATSPSHLKSGLSNKGMLYTILSENKEELLRKRMAQQQNCDENEAETSLAEPPVRSSGEQESEDKNDGKVVVEVHEELCDHDDDSLKEECIIELTNGDKEDEPDTSDQDQPSVPDCDVRPAESNDEGAATSP